MRKICFILNLLGFMQCLHSQTISPNVELYKLYSENGDFYMKSTPYDNVEESTYGKTYIFKLGVIDPIYTVDRHFNYSTTPNKINLSNDGRTIFYINDDYGDDNIEDRKSITVYVDGKLSRAYTVTDLNPCNDEVQDCYLLYRNREVINRDSTRWKDYQLVIGFNKGVSDIEKFANISNVFSRNDSVMLIDQFRQVRIFSLKTGDMVGLIDYESIYPWLSKMYRTNKVEIKQVEIPSGIDLPNSLNGKKINKAVAAKLKMKVHESYTQNSGNYKIYRVSVDGIIDSTGKLEIINLETAEGLDSNLVRQILLSKIYDTKGFFPTFEKWRFGEYMEFRKKPRSKAKLEWRKEQQENRIAYIKRLSQDSIAGFYIPKNLGDCFPQLDSLLKQKDRAIMESIPNRNDMGEYHFGLGRYIRNNWGLWGGSRLQQYFRKLGIEHPDEMSGIILDYYHDWLNGRTETWKEWEKAHQVKEGATKN